MVTETRGKKRPSLNFRFAFATFAIAALPLIATSVGAQTAPTSKASSAKKSESSVATPQLADGRPDLNGVWVPAGSGAGGSAIKKDANGNVDVRLFARDGSPTNFNVDNTIRRRADPNKPVYKPEFLQKIKDLDDNEASEDPLFFCKPAGVPRIGAPNQISQTRGQVVFLYQSGNTFRVIPTDGRAHSENLDQTFMGDSVGHWDNDALVVDVVGFNDISWLEIAGYFHSTDLHVIERLHREGNLLHYQATVEDPNVLAKPWVRTPVTLKISISADDALYEDPPCMELDTGHFVTKEHH